MKRMGIITCMIGGLFSLIGCSMKSMPEGELVKLRFVSSGTMARPKFEGTIEKDSSGVFVLKAMKENYGPMFEKRITKENMAHFRQIIEEEKMYKYKEAYRPLMQVLDGWGWSFNAKFSDGSWIDSHGSNASPSGNGLGRIEGYMNQLIQDGVQIEFLPEDDE